MKESKKIEWLNQDQFAKKINPSKGIIISFPRSGLNWVRYVIEYFSGKKTAGKPKIVTDGELACYRTHSAKEKGHQKSCYCAFSDYEGNVLHDRVVLLLRNHYESFLRIAKKRGDLPSPEEIKSGKVYHFSDYFENIKAYEECSKPKLLIRYEDLVGDEDRIFKTLGQVLDFFAVNYSFDDFNLKKHQERSIGFYENYHKSYSHHELSKTTFHQESVDHETLKALDSWCFEHYPVLFKKYCS